MAVTNGWGQAAKNNTNGYGKLATNNIGAGSIYEDSYAGDTALIGTSAAFSYSANSFTQADSNPTPTITGTTGGVFSGTSGLVFISTSTGEINLSASTIAAHVVTYTVDGVSATFNLSVLSPPYASTSSFSFDGVNDYFDLTQQDLGSVFSLSLWIKRGSTSATGETLLGAVNSTTFNQALNVDWNANILYLKGSANNNKNSWDISSVNDQNWHHYLITRNGTSTFLYLDGGSGVAGEIVTGDLTSDTKFRYLGVNGTTIAQFFNGKIDEVSIWDSVLSSAAVTEIYNSGAPNSLTSLTNASSSNLVAWYKMGE